MTVFVVGFVVIAAVVSILWLMMRPLGNEVLVLPRAEPEAFLFDANDGARYSDDAGVWELLTAEDRMRGYQFHAKRSTSHPTL
jgi:hypothetical protein